MPNKLYKNYPKDASQGPGGQPFLYQLGQAAPGKKIQIVPVPGTKLISSENIPAPHHLALPKKKKILVFEPHSDDAAFFAGNFLTRLAKNNNQIKIINLFSCFLTIRGKMSLEKKMAMRDNEDRRFAEEIGAGIQFLRLDFPYTEFEIKLKDPAGALDLESCRFGDPSPSDFEKIFQVLNQEKPDIVLLPHPFDLHQMHRDTARLALGALGADKNKMRLFFYGAGPYFRRFGVATGIYNLMTVKEADAKLSLMQIYKSQLKPVADYLNNPNIEADPKTHRLIHCSIIFDKLDQNDRKIIAEKTKTKNTNAAFCERLIEFNLRPA